MQLNKSTDRSLAIWGTGIAFTRRVSEEVFLSEVSVRPVENVR